MVVSGIESRRAGDGLTWSVPGENWPELLQGLFMASQSPDAGQREGAFRIFRTTPGIIEKQHETTVLAVFTKGFKDDDVSVRNYIESKQRTQTTLTFS